MKSWSENIDPMKEYFYLSTLEEAFKLKYVDYGTDLNNKEWKLLEEDEGNIYITFFRHDSFLYCCAFIFFKDFIRINFSLNSSSRKIMQMSNEEFETYVRDKINSLKDLKLHFNFDKTPVSNFLSVFNEVFYVMVEGLNKFKPNQIRFNGYTEKLHKIYIRMTTDINFLDEIKKVGYKFKEVKADDSVCFVKINSWEDLL